MRHLLTLFLLCSVLKISAQPSFVPEDLSYNFCITKGDLGLKGNVKTFSQEVITINTSPANTTYTTPTLFDFDTNIYEEIKDNDRLYRTPIISDLLKGGFCCQFLPNSDNLDWIHWEYNLLIVHFKYNYDKEGNIISISASDDNDGDTNLPAGNYKKTFSFVYENGLLKEKNVECNADEQVFPTTYKYDNEGRVIEATSIASRKGKPVKFPFKKPIVRTYTYAPNGEFSTVTSEGAKLYDLFKYRYRKTTWVYDKNGKLVVSTSELMKDDGKPIKTKEGFTFLSSMYLYDEQGRIDKEIMGKTCETTFSRIEEGTTTRYKYDDNGNVLMKTTKYSNNRAVVTRFTYEYDSNGNWISRNMYVNDILTTITNREISYW